MWNLWPESNSWDHGASIPSLLKIKLDASSSPTVVPSEDPVALQTCDHSDVILGRNGVGGNAGEKFATLSLKDSKRWSISCKQIGQRFLFRFLVLFAYFILSALSNIYTICLLYCLFWWLSCMCRMYVYAHTPSNSHFVETRLMSQYSENFLCFQFFRKLTRFWG